MNALTIPAVVPVLRLSDAEVGFYKREGYLYIPGIVDPEAVAGLKREVMEVLSVQGLGVDRLGKASGTADKLRQTYEYLTGSLLDGLINSPNLLSIASQLLGGPSTLYMPFTAVKAGGGGGRFHFHQDNQYTRFEEGMHGINLWIALGAMTPENGCLQVVPHSHLAGTLDAAASPDGDGHRTTKFEPEEFLPARMRAGDCIAFSRLTVHGSGPNTTPDPRVGYAIQFHRNDAKAFFNEAWRVLKNEPRFKTAPVERFTPPQASVDGH